MTAESSSQPVTRFRTTATMILEKDWRIVPVLVLLVAIVSGAILWVSQRIQREVKENLQSSLHTVVTTVHEALLIWAEDRKNDIALLAESPEVRSALAHNSHAASELRAAITPAIRTYQAIDFAVVDVTGRVIATASDTNADLRSLTQNASTLLDHAFRGEAFFGFVETGTSTSIMLIAAPIRDNTQRIIAALVFELNPAKEMTSILKLGRLRRTGETYVFDARGHLLSESRFDRTETASVATPLVSEEVTKTKTGMNLKGYPDYRGIPVVGAWEWDDALGVGVVTEMDLAEALAPGHDVSQLAFFMLVVILVVLLMILAILANSARLAAANISYQQALKARQDTIATVSHDLKNPLNTILLACTMLDTETHHRGVAIVRRAAEAMLRLIADLLDTAKLEAGQIQMDIQACTAQPLIDEVLELTAPLAERKQVQISSDVERDVPAFRADPKRVLQVLSNLIGNAVKFTPPGGIIHIAVKKATSSEVEFSVSDNGPGISNEDQTHIFDQYWQASRTGGQGSGLGLYICKSIVVATGGRIEVHSTVGQGATFVFTLPVASVSPSGPEVARGVSEISSERHDSRKVVH